MKLTEVKESFAQVIEALSGNLNELLPEDGINGMVKFYQNERVNQCDLKNDGDMLLFQYGTFNFTGKEEFQINITRQFIIDDEEPCQLQLTFYYVPSEKNKAFRSDEKWCYDPYKVSEFLNSIMSNNAYKEMHGLLANRVELLFEQC